MITNEYLNKIIEGLKEEGVSYRLIANLSNIVPSTFYFYRRSKHYPIEVRQPILNALYERFGDMIDELSEQ